MTKEKKEIKEVIDDEEEEDTGNANPLGEKEIELQKAQDEKNKSTELIEEANSAADRIEEANKETAKNLDRQERLKSQEILGGHTDAGSKQISEEEKAIESAKDLIRGTGMEDELFPKKKE